MRKRIMATVLSICMLITLMPMSAFATETNQSFVSAAKLFPYAGESNDIVITGGQASTTQTVRISGYNAPWYVTDGLVLHLDGIYNAGIGTHDAAATKWVDLAAGMEERDLTGVTWVDNGILVNDSAISLGDLNDTVKKTYENGFSMEAAFTQNERMPEMIKDTVQWTDASRTETTVRDANPEYMSPVNNLFGSSILAFRCNNSPVLFYTRSSGNWVASTNSKWGYTPADEFLQYAMSTDADNLRNLYLAGEKPNGTQGEKLVTDESYAAEAITQTTLQLPRWYQFVDGTDYTVTSGRVSESYEHTIHLFRLYDRKLTDAEIAQNAATDKLRYDTEGYNPFLGSFAGEALIEQFDADGNAYIEVEVAFDENGEATVPLVLNNQGEETLTFTLDGQSADITLYVMDKDDADAAREVEAAITALPSPESVAASDLDAVRSADGKYTALTEIQKSAVSTELVQKLNDCKAKLDESLAGAYEVTLTYDTNGGTLPEGIENTVKIIYKSTETPAYSLAVPTMDRYIFSGWYLGETKLTGGDGAALAPWDSYSDATITAKWTPAGTEAVPYEITEAEDIYALARILTEAKAPADDSAVSDELKADYARFGFREGFNEAYTHLQTASYALKSNITLTNYADDESNGFVGIPNFMGCFDGENNTITLDIDYSKYPAASRIGGVFADVKEAVIENIVLDGKAVGDFILNPASGTLVDAGLLVGYTQANTDKNTVIRNITNNASINITLDTDETYTTYIAAIVGRAQSTLLDGTNLKLTNCVNNGDFTVEMTNTASNTSRLGGLIGHAYSGCYLENCANYGDITANGVRIWVGDLVGTGSTPVVYKNCISAGNVTATEENVMILDGMANTTAQDDGNYILLNISGKAGQTIRLISTGESYTFAEDGVYSLKVPVYFQDEEKQGSAYLTTDYVAAPSGNLYWFNITNKKLTVNLQTENAITEEVLFSSWKQAIPIDSEEDFIMMQKAINQGDADAISYLYAKAGASSAGIDNEEAQAVLRSAYYKLNNDVTIDNAEFTGIGTNANYFGGHFDGGQNTVTLNMNLNIDAITGNTYYGLFGVVKPLTDGIVEIKDLNIVSSLELNIPETNFNVGIGSVAGQAYDLTMDNVAVTVEKMEISTDTEFIGTLSVGGAFGYEIDLIGEPQTVTINNTINVQGAPAIVSGKYEAMYIGGFAGSGNTGGNVNYSGGSGINAGNSLYANIGGIIGYSSSSGLDFTKLSVSNTTDGVITFQGTGVRPWVGILLGYNTTATIAPEIVALTIDGNTGINGKFAVDTASATGDNCAGGLIGRVQTTGTVVIKDVAVTEDISLSAQNYAGGFIGYLQGTGATLKIDDSASNVTLPSPVSGKTGMLIGRSDVEPQYTGSAYIKAGDIAAVGGKTDNQVIAIDVTGLTGEKAYGDQIALFADTLPAALAVAPEDTFSLTKDGKLSLDKVGTAKASFTWNGVSLYTSEDITVNAKELNNDNIIITGVNSSYPVTGSEIRPDIQIVNKDNGKALTADDYDVAYTDNTEVGTAVINITFKGNYTGSASTSFEIAATENTLMVTGEGYKGTYDKAAHGIIVTVPEGTTVYYNKDGGDDYSLSAEDVAEINAGTYVVYFKAEKDGKEVKGSEMIIIEKAPLTITANNASARVNGEMPMFSYSQTGLIDGDAWITEPKLTTSATDTSKAGTYAIKVSGADAGENYEITYADGVLTISRASSSSGSTTYAVNTPSKVENGTISVSPKNARSGNTVNITATPDNGYELSKLTVTDANGKELKVTDAGNGRYTFTMPASKVEITASFVKAGNTDSLFSDVDEKDWYYEAVKYVYDEGMMNGTSSYLFSPNMSTTRGMIITILHRLENEPAVSGNPFTDVTENAYYKEAVAWGAANSIINGYGDGKFGPDDSITREQLASILYRYAAYKGISIANLSELSAFSDAEDISLYAVETMRWAVGNGIMNGNGDGTLNPTGTATRAEAAQMLMNFCKEILK